MLFPGSLPPPLDTLDGLRSAGVTLTSIAGPTDQAHWIASAHHDAWGDARIVCLRDLAPPPTSLFDQNPRLSQAERAAAKRGRSTVSVQFEQERGANWLKARKHLLRYLAAVGGRDALVALDHTSAGVWSPAALTEELAHDADLDVASIFTIHSVTGPDEQPFWVHTHGLAALGFVDFDVVDPGSQSMLLWEVMRATAFAILEGDLAPGAGGHSIVGGPHPPVELVDSASFRRQVGDRHPLWRDALDDEHTKGHAVLCNPAPRGLRAWFGAKATPWSLL